MPLVAIVPTFRNLRTLPAVVTGLGAGGIPIIVVDDGSDDGTGEWAATWCAAAPLRWLIRFERNRGKGAALVAGLAHARTLGYDVALSVDSDGQHRIEDALRLAELARPDCLMLGARDDRLREYPARSLFGRRLWSLGVRSLTGLGVGDPVCGLRCYPLAAIAQIDCRAGRYAWEEELLVRAAWSGVTIDEVPITAVYLPAGERVSHFGLLDWTESFRVYLALAFSRILLRVRSSVPNGPLLRRERSWRRILGMSVLVGGAISLALPLAIALPLATWTAWRLHAGWPIAAATAVGAAWFATHMPALATLAVVAGFALLVTQAARCLCNN